MFSPSVSSLRGSPGHGITPLRRRPLRTGRPIGNRTIDGGLFSMHPGGLPAVIHAEPQLPSPMRRPSTGQRRVHLRIPSDAAFGPPPVCAAGGHGLRHCPEVRT